MAELVELHAEDMIPELELMEKMLLFDKNEIRTIAKKRKEFEYKLQRQSKCKEDVLRYIQYEMDLMKLIRQKRMEKGLNQKKNDLDYAIANHINKLFNFAIRLFPNDVRIWLSYIKFCKQVRFYTCASRILDQMLELHGDKPSLFKLAAQWEFEECQCVEKARKFLLNGLHMHKDSKTLYTEAFKLELNFANSKRKEIEDRGEQVNGDDPVLQGKLAEVMYDSAIKKINDVSFVVELLWLAKEYSFTEQLQKKILDDLVKRFPKEELTWDTLAKRELESVKDSTDPKLTPKERIKSCAKMYESAVKSLNTERMWTMYLDTMLELNEDTSTLPNLKRNYLTKAFTGAHNQGMMTEKYYLIWVEQLKNGENKDKLYDVLKRGTGKLKNSVTLWTARLTYHLTKDEEESAVQVFKEALAGLGSESLPIWKLMLQYWQNTSPAKVEQLFKEGISHGSPTISNPLKPMFMEWLTLNRGIVAARKQYSAYAQMPPFCLEVHTKMLELEDMQPRPSLKHMRKCHQNATAQFGANNTDVWMWYVRFEQNHGDPKNVPDIYSRAISNLKQPTLVDIFVSEFSLCKAESFATPELVTKLDPTEEPMDCS